MKLAAIDIGSNAIRFQVSAILGKGPDILFKKLEYIRFPLRLGHDVFTSGRISNDSIVKFKKLMHAFRLLIDLYDVTDYMFCATSALRESENGPELVQQVQEEIGITIHIIDGNKEAELINRAISSYLSDKTYLHIDVGGGSTELNLFFHGNKIMSRSFRVGSVRVLEHTDLPGAWTDMEHWVRKNVKPNYGKVTAVGTGGNISKVFDLAKARRGKTISRKKIQEILSMIKSHSIEDRIFKLQMNPDRADVIIPATDIYLRVMEWARASSILVPEVGLKDGVILFLYEQNLKQTKLDFRNSALP
ncbi:MAG: phosphatase [Cyclobacteriaceae bacterium]|nr:phosphatase [Cyclobacteriaceae bacterium]